MKAVRPAAALLAVLLAGIVSSGLLTACQSGPATLPLRVEIGHVVSGQALTLGSEVTLPTGDHLRIDKLRYYLSNFRLHRVDGQWSAALQRAEDASGYVLVDASQPASQAFELPGFAPGEYDAIEFLIGIDDVRNHSGAQTGVLDPVEGMFWTWNTGYIFFKLEGHSPESTAAGQIVEYHIGGGRNPSLARKVYLPLGRKPLRLQPELVSTVHLQADIAAVFQGVNTLRLAEAATLMDPVRGRPVADNIAAVFGVDHLHHEPRER